MPKNGECFRFKKYEKKKKKKNHYSKFMHILKVF